MPPTRTTIQVTVLTNEPIAEAMSNDDWTLADVHYLIDEGHGVGDFTVTSTEQLTRVQMREALIEVGNDGEFFDDDWAFEDEEES